MRWPSQPSQGDAGGAGDGRMTRRGCEEVLIAAPAAEATEEAESPNGHLDFFSPEGHMPSLLGGRAAFASCCSGLTMPAVLENAIVPRGE